MELKKIRSFSRMEIRDLIIVCENKETRQSLMMVYESLPQGFNFVHFISDADLDRVRATKEAPQ